MTESVQTAVEAALGAGASDAEAFATEAGEREVRVHGGEVESLTAATQRGIGLRAWIGNRVGFAFGTDLGEAGIAALAARATEAARAGDEDEHAGPPSPAGAAPELSGLRDSSIDSWSAAQVAEIALTVEREALAADGRVAGVEQAVYADAAERVSIATSTGIAGEYESSSCYAYTQALAKGDGGTETGLGFDLARGPAALDPAAVGARGGRAGGRDDRGRQARVASLPGGPRPDRGGELRRPDRRRARGRLDSTRALPVRGQARRGGRLRRAQPRTTTAPSPTAPPRRPSMARESPAPAPR